MALLQHPELWRVVDRWTAGALDRLTLAEYAALSHFELEACAVLRAARSRAEARRLRAAARGGAGE